jgi:hypothetical protein
MRADESTPSPYPLPHEGERGALTGRGSLGTLSPLGRGQGEGSR